MSDQLIVERGGLEKKDKSELSAIVSALGGNVSSRARKAELIDQILELSGAALPADEAGDGDDTTVTASDSPPAAESADDAEASTAAAEPTAQDRATTAPDTVDTAGAAPAEAANAEAATNEATGTATAETAEAATGSGPSAQGNDRSGNGTADAKSSNAGGEQERPRRGRGGRGGGRGNGRNPGGVRTNAAGHPIGPDGEPLADWEVEMLADQGDGGGANQKRSNRGGGNNQGSSKGNNQGNQGGKNQGGKNQGGQGNQGGNNQSNDGNDNHSNQGNQKGGGEAKQDDDVDPNNRRNRRRGRGRGRDRDDAGNEPISTEPVPVSGSLDLRDEGYGFLRVDGCLPSKDDVYVSVKQVRQYGLRKGDTLTGLSRPANRNEKNPGFHQIDTVNGKAPEEARNRPNFDDLTPLFPDERLNMEMRQEPLNMTSRIIDLVAPIGKGQRGLIVSPPKAGKTTVMKDIARAIETNNPEVRLIVLLVDERPEEVTDMRRHLQNGEVAASTFDRPPEEHCAVAELTIERAKRLVEEGEDVCLIVDGITRLARAYNLVAPQTGRAMSGGVDAGALYPPKRFFGAARNLEEGGSLTILATALVETGSRMDEVIFEEFKGTGNMELRLDRRLAEKRIFPAIDIDASSTRHEELLFDRKQLQQAWTLRRVVSGMADEGAAGAGIEMLVDRLKAFKTNDDFLAEIGKAPSL